jgi:glucose-6-phosphate 1-dehydrogenase
LGPRRSAFAYAECFDEKPSVGYETLLYHCMTGNALLFQRDDMIEASWAAVQPVLDDWANLVARMRRPPMLPAAMARRRADELLARDGRRWRTMPPVPRSDPTSIGLPRSGFPIGSTSPR